MLSVPVSEVNCRVQEPMDPRNHQCPTGWRCEYRYDTGNEEERGDHSYIPFPPHLLACPRAPPETRRILDGREVPARDDKRRQPQISFSTNEGEWYAPVQAEQAAVDPLARNLKQAGGYRKAVHLDEHLEAGDDVCRLSRVAADLAVHGDLREVESDQDDGDRNGDDTPDVPGEHVPDPVREDGFEGFCFVVRGSQRCVCGAQSCTVRSAQIRSGGFWHRVGNFTFVWFLAVGHFILRCRGRSRVTIIRGICSYNRGLPRLKASGVLMRGEGETVQ